MKKIIIIANSKHKKALNVRDALKMLLGDDYIVEAKYTEKKAHAIELSKEAINDGCDYLIAVGGDGTINEVVNGVMTSEKKGNTIVGLLPMGTGNDFARSVNPPKDVKELADLIKENSYLNVDVGHLEFMDAENISSDRFFINIADIGVGAKTVELVNSGRKIINSNFTFILAVLRSFIGYKRQKVSVIAEDFKWSGEIVAVCAANGKYFGSGLGIAPYANLNNGKLSLVLVGKVKMFHFLRFLPRLKALKPIEIKQVDYKQVTSFQIISENKYPVEMDGENVGYTPIKAKVIPNAIKFLSKLFTE